MKPEQLLQEALPKVVKQINKDLEIETGITLKAEWITNRRGEVYAYITSDNIIDSPMFGIFDRNFFLKINIYAYAYIHEDYVSINGINVTYQHISGGSNGHSFLYNFVSIREDGTLEFTKENRYIERQF
jgi:hypothetical protein